MRSTHHIPGCYSRSSYKMIAIADGTFTDHRLAVERAVWACLTLRRTNSLPFTVTVSFASLSVRRRVSLSKVFMTVAGSHLHHVLASPRLSTCSPNLPSP